MNNVTNEELLAAIAGQIGSLREEMNKRFEKIDRRLDSIEDRLDVLEEDSEVTREGVNALLEWADVVGKISKYPIAK